MTQEQQILQYLKRGYSLTPLKALKLFGTLRLGARVWDIKRRGYRIARQMIEVGDGKRVACYRLAKPS